MAFKVAGPNQVARAPDAAFMEKDMDISYPFNVTNTRTGEVIESTRAFHNRYAAGYSQELEEATRYGVARAKKHTQEFAATIRNFTFVKWAYTVYRELYVVPERVGTYEVPHSIAAGNQPVFCGGFAEYQKGDIVMVNNWTGHYRVPSTRAASDIVEAWADSGFTPHVDGLI